jgi:hypothetical protein
MELQKVARCFARTPFRIRAKDGERLIDPLRIKSNGRISKSECERGYYYFEPGLFPNNLCSPVREGFARARLMQRPRHALNMIRPEPTLKDSSHRVTERNRSTVSKIDRHVPLSVDRDNTGGCNRIVLFGGHIDKIRGARIALGGVLL